MARFTYLDPRAKDFFADWNRTAKECVAALRTQAGRYPFDRDLSDLVGELSTQCEEFAALWATHNVRLHRKAEKYFHHPVVGDLTLRYDRLAVVGDPGLEIFAYIWRSPGHHPRRHSTSWPVVRRTGASGVDAAQIAATWSLPSWDLATQSDRPPTSTRPSAISTKRPPAAGVGYGTSGIAPGDQGGPGPW